MSMPLTDQQNRYLSDRSYDVDVAKTGKEAIRAGMVLTDKSNQKYKVTNTLDDKKLDFKEWQWLPM
ncbi:hypothetical protein [Fructilactobacillus carniphilus]|uniref:Uncharacterized protein n=1 Tax=Fructilactobacillus carniphilus TaxID=2940297 RepID=A0ABY5BXN9_9LACO|nr:hypothetical protein [Fructilactobacillus carniphilus]USS90569.1 hypothetical protein M3M37_06975 [Fructilactobacillus carniphilus]